MVTYRLYKNKMKPRDLNFQIPHARKSLTEPLIDNPWLFGNYLYELPGASSIIEEVMRLVNQTEMIYK